MSSVKRLVYAVIHFLREQSQMDTFTPDEQESLEVAIQCLETVFKINLEDTHLAPPQHLIEMFTNSFHKNDMLPLSDSLPEDIEKADQLKDEGNNHMKEENYDAAVDCYTRAIELDPNNAVYYCNRAAAQSKLNKYSEAIKDCKRAIAIDPKYSKAYGRMGLALTSVNKYEEAVTSYQKALDLDPENDSYKSNLKIAEQKLRDMSSPTGTGLSFDMASLINNPAFISMDVRDDVKCHRWPCCRCWWPVRSVQPDPCGAAVCTTDTAAESRADRATEKSCSEQIFQRQH
ncbi:small glutamine-rich tetratricopeptide repeat-containing protein beta isoform X2 [Calypte anna]|uniref:small glutamine-rich tetratricopeptide repeat-containing protein beta isoform X2 n=1 Tax=Calypte anna TaxID=9244 RepID=UPI0011C45C48|nr:small glutamine-rich tetratricopeptide repeat-containing protein beta isoform X2 [Calypte anna]